MPYKVSGSDLLHYKDGKWSVKQHCSSHANAVEAMQLLQMKEHGVTPKGGWRDSDTKHASRRLAAGGKG
jgi:Zn/Cd-binding protein ZinT